MGDYPIEHEIIPWKVGGLAQDNVQVEASRAVDDKSNDSKEQAAAVVLNLVDSDHLSRRRSRLHVLCSG